MSNARRTETERLRELLGPTRDCLSIEELERYANAVPDNLPDHLATCPHCRAELHLLREFQSAEPRADEREAVRTVTRRLRAGVPEIVGRRHSWWRSVLAARWLSPAALAMAGILVVCGITLQLRQGTAPALHPVGGAGPEVMRSGSLTLVTPRGDLSEPPTHIEWRPVQGAVQYQVRLLEVDQTELWKSSTSAGRIELPAAVRRLAVPGKTILMEVTALDAGSRRIAQSEPVRFRVTIPR